MRAFSPTPIQLIVSVAEFTLETGNSSRAGNSSIKIRLGVNLRRGNSGFYSVFDEINVLLRFPTLFFTPILFI